MQFDPHAVDAALARHPRAAVQFSGGRDSTALVYLLRPWWDRLSFYYLSTGDEFPETVQVVQRVSQDVPLTMIFSNVRAWRREHGWPVDLLPADNTYMGRMESGREVKLVGRFDCCVRNLMQPLHERMLADGITLLVRGQRDDELAAPAYRSGQTGEGFEFLYPLQAWTGADVSRYLADNDLPVAPFYERGMTSTPDCMGCTAWWAEGREQYLAEHHPAQHRVHVLRMGAIQREIDRQLRTLVRPEGLTT